MPQNSPNKNLSCPKVLQCHQITKHHDQQLKPLISNQRVLILSTPVKLKDGTVNMEQRTIPLRIDNGPLALKTEENTSKIIPQPLALPIHQLNKKLPTFVKNEVGQVLGKLIPLGKFSNITQNTLEPVSAIPSTPATPVTPIKNIKHEVIKQTTKWGGYKLLKLDKQVIEASKIASEKFAKMEKSKQNQKKNSVSESKIKSNKNTLTVSSSVIKHVRNIDEQLITVTNVKPKKQVHLVLKGYKNIASIGQTGTNIKLIPLEQWKLDVKSNFPKTEASSSMDVQPTIVDVRSCTVDEMDGSDNTQFHENQLNCNYDKEDFNIDEILEKDPLDIEGLSNEETATFAHSLNRSASNNSTDQCKELELSQQSLTIDKTDSNCITAESKSLDNANIINLLNNEPIVGPRIIGESKIENPPIRESKVSLSNDIVNITSSEMVEKNEEKFNTVISSAAISVEGYKEVKSNDIGYDNLCKRFQIPKDDITLRERAMLSYICNLKKKLSRNQKTRVQTLSVSERRKYLGISNLSNIQKRFIESQLRNSGRAPKKHRFTKPDMVMARDILRATGPKSYNNLRKLFSLPSMSAIVKAVSKTQL